VAAARSGSRLVQRKMRVNKKVRAYALPIFRHTNLVQNVYGSVCQNWRLSAEPNAQMLD
jgi:hypothetical protein